MLFHTIVLCDTGLHHYKNCPYNSNICLEHSSIALQNFQYHYHTVWDDLSLKHTHSCGTHTKRGEKWGVGGGFLTTRITQVCNSHPTPTLLTVSIPSCFTAKQYFVLFPPLSSSLCSFSDAGSGSVLGSQPLKDSPHWVWRVAPPFSWSPGPSWRVGRTCGPETTQQHWTVFPQSPCTVTKLQSCSFLNHRWLHCSHVLS